MLHIVPNHALAWIHWSIGGILDCSGRGEDRKLHFMGRNPSIYGHIQAITHSPQVLIGNRILSKLIHLYPLWQTFWNVAHPISLFFCSYLEYKPKALSPGHCEWTNFGKWYHLFVPEDRMECLKQLSVFLLRMAFLFVLWRCKERNAFGFGPNFYFATVILVFSYKCSGKEAECTCHSRLNRW